MNGLAQARQRADGDAAGARVGAKQVADQEVAAMKFVEVLVDHQADEQIPARLLLFFGRERVERFGQDLVSWTIADFMDDVLLNFGEGPGFADGRAALGRDAGKFDVAADRNCDAAFL